jgi:uncharacterized membrane protein
MAGRHEGKADSLAVIVGVPLGILGFLAFLAWLIYLMTSAQTSRLSLVIIGSIAVLVWVAALVIKWREDKRFPLFIALAVTPVFNLAHLLAPSWQWINWVGYVVGSGIILILTVFSARHWRQYRTERGRSPWPFKIAKD